MVTTPPTASTAVVTEKSQDWRKRSRPIKPVARHGKGGYTTAQRRARALLDQEVEAEECSVDEFLAQHANLDTGDVQAVGAFLNRLGGLFTRTGDSWSRALVIQLINRCVRLSYFENSKIKAKCFQLMRRLLARLPGAFVATEYLSLVVVHSLDTSSDPDELMYAFRLGADLLLRFTRSPISGLQTLAGSFFPRDVIACLVSQALKKCDSEETFFDLRVASLGIVAEVAVANPCLIAESVGVGWIVGLAHGRSDNHAASIIGHVLISWLDLPQTRSVARLDLVLEQIFGPIIDFAFFDGLLEAQRAEYDDGMLSALSVVCLIALRSWAGVFSCAAFDVSGEPSPKSPFYFITLLGHATDFTPGVACVFEFLVGVLCEFLDTSYASVHFASWTDALVFYTRQNSPDTFKSSLKGDFVVGEVECLLNNRKLTCGLVDCLASFRAVALHILMSYGLQRTLSALILCKPDHPTSYKATLLLADVVNACSGFLPHDQRLKWLMLPDLVQATMEHTLHPYRKWAPGSEKAFPNSQNASLLLSRLDQLSDACFGRASVDLTMHNTELFVLGGRSMFGATRGRAGSMPEAEAEFDHLVAAHTELFSRGPFRNADLVKLEGVVVCLENDNGLITRQHKHNEKLHLFFAKVFHMVLPENEAFVKEPHLFTPHTIKCFCRAVVLVATLVDVEPHYGELINNFLTQFKECLAPDNLRSGVFSQKNIPNTPASYYFAILAAIGSTATGFRLVENSGIFQIYLDLLTGTTSMEYVKLIVTSLNYGQPGLPRIVLQTALTATYDDCRKWTTRFLEVLLVTNEIREDDEFVISLWIDQLADRNSKVVRHAVRLLHTWLPRYPSAMRRLYGTELRPLGPAGVFLRSHVFGDEAIMKEIPLAEVKCLIELWMEKYAQVYVDTIEENVRTALLNVKKSMSGRFARPSAIKFDRFGVRLRVHLFGMLAKHAAGQRALAESQVLPRLVQRLQDANFGTEDGVQKVKGALLSLAQIAACLAPEDFPSQMPRTVIGLIVSKAESCPVLSVKGVAIWALHVVSSSAEGAKVLASFGWESNMHPMEVVSFDHRGSSKIARSQSFCHCKEEDRISPFPTRRMTASSLASPAVPKARTDLDSFPQRRQTPRRITVNANPKQELGFVLLSEHDSSERDSPSSTFSRGGPISIHVGADDDVCCPEKLTQMIQQLSKATLSENKAHYDLSTFSVSNSYNSSVKYTYLSRKETEDIMKHRVLLFDSESVDFVLSMRSTSTRPILSYPPVCLPQSVGIYVSSVFFAANMRSVLAIRPLLLADYSLWCPVCQEQRRKNCYVAGSHRRVVGPLTRVMTYVDMYLIRGTPKIQIDVDTADFQTGCECPCAYIEVVAKLASDMYKASYRTKIQQLFEPALKKLSEALLTGSFP